MAWGQARGLAGREGVRGPARVAGVSAARDVDMTRPSSAGSSATCPHSRHGSRNDWSTGWAGCRCAGASSCSALHGEGGA